MPNLTDFLDELRADDPARNLPALSYSERLAVRDRILTTQRGRPTARPARPRVKRRRRLVLAVGLAVVAIALAGVFGLHTGVTAQPALAAQMNELAQVASDQDWTGIPGPGQYLYTESEECQVNDVVDRKIWIATDGSGAIDQSIDPSLVPPRCPAKVDPNEAYANRFPAGGLSFPTQDWHSLSTDPSTLLAQLRTLDGGPVTAAEDFVHIGDFMRESDTPPAIRSALYKAAALIPGVRLIGQQTDPTGQTGVGVGFYDSGTIQSELIFDPQTGRLLAEQSFDASGKLTAWTAYVEQKIVGTGAFPNYPMSPASTDTSSSVNGG